MTEIFENEYGETWFYFHPSGHKGDGIYGWGNEDDAQRYLDVLNADLNPDEGEFWFVDGMTEEEFEDISKPIDGFNINDALIEFRSKPDDEQMSDEAA